MKKIKYLIIGLFVILFSLVIWKEKANANTENFHNKVSLVDVEKGITVDVSKLNIESATDKVLKHINQKTLHIYQNGTIIDTIKYNDLELSINLNDEILNAKMKNDSIKGFKKLLKNEIPISLNYILEEENLSYVINSLNCTNNYIKSENATTIVINGEMLLVNAIYGNELDKEKFLDILLNAITTNQESINLDELNCYIQPTITDDNKMLLSKIETYNKYTSANITYLFGSEEVSIPKETIGSWIEISDENEVIFNDEKMLLYIKELGKKYNNFAQSFDFTTSKGQTIRVPGGDYGWSISQTKEVEKLKTDLLSLEVVKREPTWLYVGYGEYSKTIGDSYVEISIPDQHLWLYVDGDLILETDLVSGKESNKWGTPSGVFGLTYKTRNATLRGANYATPVSYWMPFNGNIGMHDATWRNEFGGNIYINNGSHGCINLPKEYAREIYSYIETFFPIIVYDEELNI